MNIPPELIAIDQWVNWKYETRQDKQTKVPYQPTNIMARVNQRATYSRYDSLSSSDLFDGIGFVVTPDDPYCAIDIDHCLTDGVVNPEAQKVVDLLNSYTEITPSGTGVRVWVKAELPEHKGRKTHCGQWELELYDASRFLTVTGNALPLYPEDIESRQPEIDQILQEFFTDTAEIAPPKQTPSFEDQEIIDRMFACKTGEAIKALWHGDLSAYSDDDSRADYGLAQAIAFWTQNPEQVERIMRSSCLARAKWDRKDYLPDTVRKAIASKVKVYTPPPPPAAEETKSAGNSACDWLLSKMFAETELFCTAEGETFLRFYDTLRTYPIKSVIFRSHLRNLYWEQRNLTLTDEMLKRTVDTLDAIAQHKGQLGKAYMRIAPDGRGGIYIDLRNDDWEVVHVTSSGWKIETGCPVLFKRARNSAGMVKPDTRGDLNLLRQYLNIDQRQWMLLTGCLVSYLHPKGPYPLLSITGEQGSGKSTACKLIKRLIDPAAAELYSMPAHARDVMTSAVNNWLLAYENLSNMPPWLSDIFCILSTGGGHATRELYTDMDEKVLNAKRPIVTNGIPDIVTRPDLLSRSIVLELGPMDGYKTESELDAAFEEDLPKIFGGLLDVMSVALKWYGKTVTDKAARMADFVTLAAAAAKGLGWEPVEFLAAYSDARMESEDIALECAPVVLALEAFISAQPEQRWEGSARDLLLHITPGYENGKFWPRNGNALTNIIRRYAPSLRNKGLNVGFFRVKNVRVLTIIKTEAIPPGFELPEPMEPTPVEKKTPGPKPGPAPDKATVPTLVAKEIRKEQALSYETRINRLLDEGRIDTAQAEAHFAYIYRWLEAEPDTTLRTCSVCGEPVFWQCGSETLCISCYPPSAGMPLKLALAVAA